MYHQRRKGKQMHYYIMSGVYFIGTNRNFSSLGYMSNVSTVLCILDIYSETCEVQIPWDWWTVYYIC